MTDVSIIIPVFNRPELVKEAIASAMGEGREVIVVDDCSTDSTWETLQAYGDAITLLRTERNSGQSTARNVGIDRARGDYLKFLDSDDLLVPGFLEKEIATARQTNADIVVSGWVFEFADGRRREYKAPEFSSIVDDVLAGRSVLASAALYRRGKSARWDPSVRKLVDWDFFVQSALGVERIVTLPGVSCVIREHQGPRLSYVPMLINSQAHHHILRKMEERLEAEDRLTPARRLRLAQYFYKELRVLSIYDRAGFDWAINHIFELDPHFTPRDEEHQWWMRAAARVLGTRRAVLLYSLLRRARDRMTSATRRSQV